MPATGAAVHPSGHSSGSVTVELGQLAAMVAAGAGTVVALMYEYTVAGARASSGDARVREMYSWRRVAMMVQVVVYMIELFKESR